MNIRERADSVILIQIIAQNTVQIGYTKINDNSE